MQVDCTQTPDHLAGRLLSIGKSTCLLLGASDTGKTTLTLTLAKRLARSHPVAIVDADIGQSHIGPPTTVGWAIVDSPDVDFSSLEAAGISFVGDVTPLRRLLQLAAGIILCVEQASKAAESVLIDTPGFIEGQAGCALWWTVYRMLAPQLTVAAQRSNELDAILRGLRGSSSAIESVECPLQIPTKSSAQRREYRRQQFARYFRNCELHKFDLNTVGVETGSTADGQGLVSRLIGLRDGHGMDTTVGVVENWQTDENTAVIRAPALDKNRIRCLVIGDIALEQPYEES